MKRKLLVGMLGLAALPLPAPAQIAERIYLQVGALTRPAGDSQPGDIEGGLGWSLPWHWGGGRLSSRLDMGLGYTRNRDFDAWRVLAVPMLRYRPLRYRERGLFAELGIGLTYLSSSHLAPHHDLGSHLQFEDRLGFGYAHGGNELGLSLTHFSNAGLKMPNPGADMISVRFSRDF